MRLTDDKIREGLTHGKIIWRESNPDEAYGFEGVDIVRYYPSVSVDGWTRSLWFAKFDILMLLADDWEVSE